ncbi:TMV resistance protein N-like isoform X2 [Lotus japonicus]|nr:TMV resistance protein N-like isoform X2 [Lotus japonicus]XP_057445960.1 TMV resistance protein N-like isoform X2 [Lotus japonicus]
MDYASSSFCLDELVTIIQCVKEKGRLVLPVFYDVDPSHVRHQRGTYAEALAKHEKWFQNNKEKLKDNMERLQKWKTALNQAANLSGSHFKSGNEYEHEFIGKILKEISDRLSRIPLHVADYPVGLESRVLAVMSLLDVGSDGVQMVGFYGIGGVGKTTLARAVYNLIADQFECFCFLHNVRENSNKHGLEHLQEYLLSEVVGLNIKLGGVTEGISVIKQRLKKKKVLLILDDVDNLEQLCSLVGEPSWFGSGSRVIITTRDKHLLSSYRVERKYEVYGLSTKEALDLLSWNAFKTDEDDPCYENVLNQAVAYASSLPLALEVIGSNLYRKSIQEWKSALEQYERIPDKKIQKILKVSFDALEEEQQSIFLDIACCFKGYQFKEVENILNAHHDQCIKYQIGVLVDKSLIKITHSGQVTLHDLIEDMGKEIVRQESPKVFGKRSRLWSHKDIFEVLGENTGTSKIQMMHLDYRSFEEVDWDGEAFKKMKTLKTLIIRKCHFSKGPKYLPNSLRVLEWWKYPLQHFPCDFHPKKLSVCKLPESNFMSLDLLSSSKKFVTMKVLKLEQCEYLTQMPDMSSLPNLEKLSFAYCTNLITMGHSVLSSDKLKILNAFGCKQLKSVPPLKLPSLEKLKLSGCSSLVSFPEILEKMENVTKLNLHDTNIREFPSSFQNLSRLGTLEVTGLLPPRSLVMIPQVAELLILEPLEGILETQENGEEKVSSMLLYSNVEYLQLRECVLSDQLLAVVLPWFPHLLVLDLSESQFTILPECIKQCHFLWKLVLDGCKQLQEIEGIPPSLKRLSAIGCESLSFSCRSMLLKQEIHEAGNTDFILPSPETGRIPEWFELQSRGPSPSLYFWFRNNFPHNLLFGFAFPLTFLGSLELCLAYPLPQKMYLPKKCFYFIDNGKVFIDLDFYGLRPLGGCTHLFNMLPKEGEEEEEGEVEEGEEEIGNEWHHAEVRFVNDEQISSDVEIGIHVLKEQSNMEDIRFTSPYKKRKTDLNLPALQENDVNTELTL